MGGAMDGVATLLQDARDAYARRDWPRARDGLLQPRAIGVLPADDVYALADAAWEQGLIDEAQPGLGLRPPRFVKEERLRQAALTTLWIGYTLALRGDGAVGSGWMNAPFGCSEDEPECVEHGDLHYIELESATRRERIGNGDRDGA